LASSDGEEPAPEEESELPPLETVQKEEEKEETSTAPVSSALYSYADGTSSEEESNQPLSSGIMHYNDLEELD